MRYCKDLDCVLNGINAVIIIDADLRVALFRLVEPERDDIDDKENKEKHDSIIIDNIDI